MSVRQNGKTIAGSNKYLPDLFDYKTSDHLLKNPAWLRADTFSWHSGDMYIPAYEQLVAEANNFSDIVQETVNGITIEFTLNENGHKIVNGQDATNVAKVNEIYEQTGCSWYYILDIVNKRFKLPREVMRDKDAKLIESQTSATSWYRLYDDGWVEQGINYINNTSTNTFNLPLEMKDTDYSVLLNAYANMGSHILYVTSRTTTQISLYHGDNKEVPFSFEVRGWSNRTYKSPKPQYLYFYVGPFAQKEILNDPDIPAILDTKQDKATAVNHHYITNCITNIPQDIKFELNNGILTLKAGSKVYIPNGFEQDGITPHYDIQIISSDKSVNTYGYDVSCLLFYDYTDDLLKICYKGQCSYGSSYSTTGGSLFYWYDVNTNLIRRSTDGSVWEDNLISLPLSECQSSTTEITSINYIFNGMGHIGASIFILPGLTYLIPDGRNDDGSLKNYEYTFDKIYWITDPNNSYKLAAGQRVFGFRLLNGELTKHWNLSRTTTSGKDCNKPTTVDVTNARIYFAIDTNKQYFSETGTTTTNWIEEKVIILGEYGKADDAITYLSAFYPKLVYNVSYNEHNVIDFMMPHSSNNYTWFRLYSDGWVEQGGITGTVQAGTGITINLPITMANNKYYVSTQPVRVNTDDYWYESLITSISTASFVITPVRNGSGTDTAYAFWEIKGMSAYSV